MFFTSYTAVSRQVPNGAKLAYSCCCSDVSHLKDINDRFGYSVGDDVLRTVADALIESARSTDLVARYGGDEFTLLLIEAAAEDVTVIIHRVQQKLQQLSVYRTFH